MKKMLIVLLMISIIATLTACGSGDNYYLHSDVRTPNGSRMDEWVSPDGVHYWILNNQGVAPRYDSNGMLVIG